MVQRVRSQHYHQESQLGSEAEACDRLVRKLWKRLNPTSPSIAGPFVVNTAASGDRGAYVAKVTTTSLVVRAGSHIGHQRSQQRLAL